MHQKLTLAILIIGIAAVAKGQTTKHDSLQTKGKANLTSYQQGHVYDIMSVDDKVVSLQVDNKKIDPADFHLYDSVLKAINTDRIEDREHDAEERDEQTRDREQAQRDREQSERDREQANRDREQADRDRDNDQKQGERDREQAREDQKQAQRDRQQAQEDQKQAVRDREQGDRDREQGLRDREQGQRDREQGELDRKQAEEERRIMQEFLNDLVTEKIVPDVKSINSVVLTDTELIVNDKKQAPQLQQKLKNKYSNWAKCGLSYGCCQASGTIMHFSN